MSRFVIIPKLTDRKQKQRRGGDCCSTAGGRERAAQPRAGVAGEAVLGLQLPKPLDLLESSHAPKAAPLLRYT